ncbi:hypothetical protein JCM14469_18280 [Desulfatiferula olefinivorans]
MVNVHLLVDLALNEGQWGGMQVQANVLDPDQMIEARNHPEYYSHLLVRVSGYSVCFSSLTPLMKDGIIRRSTLRRERD